MAEAEDKDKRRSSLPGAPDFGWSLLAWVGLIFLVVGLTDIAFAWYPPRFGSPQWEFATISRTYDFLPLPTMGLALTLGGAIAAGKRWMIVAVSVVLLFLALGLLAADFLYATNIPIALKAVTVPVARTGIKRAIAKNVVQGIIYPLAFAWLGTQGLRRARLKGLGSR